MEIEEPNLLWLYSQDFTSITVYNIKNVVKSNLHQWNCVINLKLNHMSIIQVAVVHLRLFNSGSALRFIMVGSEGPNTSASSNPTRLDWQ